VSGAVVPGVLEVLAFSSPSEPINCWRERGSVPQARIKHKARTEKTKVLIVRFMPAFLSPL
jgi:hypothetical protein